MSGLEKMLEKSTPIKQEREESSGSNLSKNREVVLAEFDAEHSEREDDEFYQLYSDAQQLYLDGDDDNALQRYVEAATLARNDGPELFQCYKNMGNILLRVGDLSNAESFYLKAYTINPDSDALLVNFGTLEMQKGNNDKALERFRAAAQLNSANERAWIGLALIHREYGDQDLAWANIEKALDIDSSYPIAMDLAFDWGVKDSRFDAVISRAEAYLEEKPENVDVRVKLSKALICCSRINQALNYLEEVLSLDPGNEEASSLFEALKNPHSTNAQVIRV